MNYFDSGQVQAVRIKLDRLSGYSTWGDVRIVDSSQLTRSRGPRELFHTLSHHSRITELTLDNLIGYICKLTILFIGINLRLRLTKYLVPLRSFLL